MRGRSLWRVLIVVITALLIALTGWLLWRRSPNYGLPLVVQPLTGKQQWTGYGGTWVFNDSTIENASDERGAKLVGGSPYWRNYAVDADVQLEADGGDAGLLLRVQEAEEGVDAFRGIYTGLRVQDSSLIAGQADYGWSELVPRHTAISLQPYTWYHLRAAIVDCNLTVQASTGDGKPLAGLQQVLGDCSDRGQFGLRAYRAGGSWRNIRVERLRGKEGERQ